MTGLIAVGAPHFTSRNESSLPRSLARCIYALLILIGTLQSLWDAVLQNVKVVVSTYQILLDALSHAFVRMESISLIVFDEG